MQKSEREFDEEARRIRAIQETERGQMSEFYPGPPEPVRLNRTEFTDAIATATGLPAAIRALAMIAINTMDDERFEEIQTVAGRILAAIKAEAYDELRSLMLGAGMPEDLVEMIVGLAQNAERK